MWLASGCAAGNDTGGISQGVTGTGVGGGSSGTSSASGGAGGHGGSTGHSTASSSGTGSSSSGTGGGSGGGASSSSGSGTGGTGGAACVPTTEVCDGIDNNCDGIVDEGCGCKLGDTQPCYSGPAGTKDIGACSDGVQTCDLQGHWGTCVGEVNPSAETCDGVDNDCNGMKDDGLGVSTCGLGICQITVDNCVNGVPQPCVAGLPAPEKCNGVDDSCDGVIDEGCSCTDGSTQGCYTGSPATLNIGECKGGTQTCVGGQWGACSGETLPAIESCNAKDDDCDGVVDDGLGTVNCGIGECSKTVTFCVGGNTQTCTPGTPTPETCDGKDNDCDGAVDNGLGTTTCGIGECLHTVPFCTNGLPSVCNPLPPTTETCDGKDNNCNGAIDDGNPGGGGTCTTGNSGVCAAGTLTCTGGAVACIQNTQPSGESCDGLDNNCNGAADEGNPGGNVVCSTGLLGVCSPGLTSCTNGSIVCNQNVQSSPEVCDGVDNNCNGVADEGNPGGGVACNTGLLGVCSAGTTSCVNGAIVCNQNVQPSGETCDGLDNNCDGTVDNGNPGGGLLCNTGLQGVCSTGTTACTNGAIACNQNTQPSPETCDGLDNDCNGTVDNGNPGGNAACNTGKLGVCSAGLTACTAGQIACNQTTQASAETCDGLDNNCDGTVDNGNPGGGASCSTGKQGVCSTGTTACTAGAIACNQNTQPSAEACDGLDNDCNGVVDNGNPGGGASCGTGKQGVCSVGTTACTAGAIACNQNVQPSGETCDGLDNDCNGVVDNGNPGGGSNCNTGNLGVCSAGTTACAAGAVVCTQNVQPSAETCDGLDNNCNGAVDDGNPGGGLNCGTGKQGICAVGTTACTAGAIACNQNNQPTVETCDGLDNDCNGVVDNGNPGSGASCSTGKQGVCSAGTTACTAGAIACNQNTQPSAETCDGLDNDCNGVVDNGNPGGGASCSTGKLGVCAPGVTACTSGAVACNQLVQPSAESCDGLDNNCNGVIDDGNPGGGLSCGTGQQGICAAGTTACSAGAIACNRNQNPSAETCDGLDNDCNGVIDNGNPGGGAACGTGKLGVCAAGTTICSSGAVACNQNVQPSAETCDGLDNDCNGVIDNGNPGGGLACSTGKQGVCAAGTTACAAGAVKCSQNSQPSTEICDGLDNNCDGLVDINPTIAGDNNPNSCGAAGNLAINIAPGGLQDVSGYIDAKGDDFFVVNFTGIGGAPSYYHPKIDLINNGGGQFIMDLETSCGAGYWCGADENTVEMAFNQYSDPNGCTALGNCSDGTARTASWVVRVHRTSGAANCSTYTVRVSNQ